MVRPADRRLSRARLSPEVRANSDYRRFDDVLRLVLDCTPVQRRAIEEVLAAAHGRGDIVYGIHPSASALITCLLFSLKDFGTCISSTEPTAVSLSPLAP